ncbi:MAG: S-layer homology domain-containing protein, partial [Oscillospiraceae bacterium]|nr:S-layer homology domain-containing protein [Oscillospiraceae bacterium]
MKKKISLILALVLTLSLFAMPAAAAADQTEVENTIRALGIMTGDEKGRMNLSDNITRAEFVKLAVNASVYKDTAAEASGYSLFKDVKSSHWASPSVKIAVDNGWVTGYSDGTFRPDKGITLEEAATLAVRMLGYTQADLVGAFPDAQLAKYRALGLDANVTATRGQTVTRRDCMNIFYNMLTADTKQGTAYATTLGYRLDSAGEMNYTALVNAGVEGPAILKSGSALAAALPFTTDNMTVYRNGSLSTAASAQAYDVCYYHKNLRT